MLSKRILVLVSVLIFLTLLFGCLPEPPNQAPVITSTPVTDGEVGIGYVYDVDATDPDGDTLTYSLVSKPTNMGISSTTGLINWIPAVPGVFNVVVKVSDGDLDITQSFNITVIEEEEPSPTPTPTPTPPKKYTITATTSSGGSISPSGAVIVNKGSDKTFTITPDVNYHALPVLVDGVPVGAVASYTFTNVSADHTIHANFAIDTHTITASSGPGCSINPTGTVVVDHGANQSFTITPDSVFFWIDNVLVDTSSVGAVPSYNFTNVTANHIIVAQSVFKGSVWNQTQNDYYDFIQVAIDSPTTYPDDTILVREGTYNENVAIDKSLTLLGAQTGECAIGRTGDEAEIVGSIYVSSNASDFTIDGFKLTGTGTTPLPVCMRIESVSATIINNIIVAVEPVSYQYSGLVDLEISDADIECNDFSGVYEDDRRPNVLRLGIAGSASTVTVANNEMHDVGGGGGIGIMCTDASAIIEITDNVIDNTGDCIWAWNSTFDTLLITDNDILNCHYNNLGAVNGSYIGVKVAGGVTGNIQIHDNNIEGNEEYGIYNDSNNAAVNAIDNWWGNASGPYHPMSNPFGLGDEVSNYVIYYPWSIVPN